MKSAHLLLGTLSFGLLTSLMVVLPGPRTGVQELAEELTPSAPADRAASREDRDRAEADEVAGAIAAALTEAQSGKRGNTEARSIARMTSAERSAFRLAMHDCWTFDPGSPVGETIVTVEFDLDRDGKVTRPVQLVSYDGPMRSETREQAFEAAQRAILLCQSQVVPIPPEEHDNVRRAEMTFDARTWTIL